MSIDWSDISKLKFRDYDAKILEVFVPKNGKVLSRKDCPVIVFVELPGGGIAEFSYTLGGQYLKHLEGSEDIIQITEEPFSFLEIVELIGKGAKFRNVATEQEVTIITLDLIGLYFSYIDDYQKSFIKSYENFVRYMSYSLDGINYLKLYKEIK